MGKKSYVFRYGVMYIGMTLTVLLTIPELIFDGKISIPLFVARLIIFPTIGTVLAGRRWEKREKIYLK
jgi:hypothetical protein